MPGCLLCILIQVNLCFVVGSRVWKEKYIGFCKYVLRMRNIDWYMSRRSLIEMITALEFSKPLKLSEFLYRLSYKCTFFGKEPCPILKVKPRSHCPGLRCRFTPVWWSGMNRDEPCHNRGGTVDNLGDPGWTVLNRVKPAHVPGCFKMFKTTGTHRE